MQHLVCIFDRVLGLLSGIATGVLKNAILTCVKSDATAIEINEFAYRLYGTLSDEVHGAPWNPESVELSETLNEQDKCVLVAILKDMKLL